MFACYIVIIIIIIKGRRKVMESLIRSNRIESGCQIMQMSGRAAYCDLDNAPGHFAFRPPSCAAYQFNPQTYPPVPICRISW